MTTKSKKTKKTEDMKTKCAQYEEMLKRIQAEFENYKKRVEKENALRTRFAACDMITKLIPILDSFDVALKNEKEPESSGVYMIYKQLFRVLESEGVRKMDALGKEFNPHYHEILMTENKKEVADNIITEVIQEGYMQHEKVLRYAKVKVNRKEDTGKKQDTDKQVLNEKDGDHTDNSQN